MKYTKPKVSQNVATKSDCLNQKCVARSGMGMCKITFLKVNN